MDQRITPWAPTARRVESGRTSTANNTSHSGSWTADVETLEIAIAQLTANRPTTNDCRVAFFEVDSDADLHVNVTHKHQTVAVKGWSGPATLPDGFLHNRRFHVRQPILRHIRDMIFAARA
jgi:hypothetical protein